MIYLLWFVYVFLFWLVKSEYVSGLSFPFVFKKECLDKDIANFVF
jgi:hypothetical protein